MTNPTEQFRESVESALRKLPPDPNHVSNLAYAEALASIQASMVELLEGLKNDVTLLQGKFYGDDGISYQAKSGHGYLTRTQVKGCIDQLIKDLSNGQ